MHGNFSHNLLKLSRDPKSLSANLNKATQSFVFFNTFTEILLILSLFNTLHLKERQKKHFVRVCIIYCSSRESGIEQKTQRKTNKRKTTFFSDLILKHCGFKSFLKRKFKYHMQGAVIQKCS